jgi:fatty-acyl-CoA synthase
MALMLGAADAAPKPGSAGRPPFFTEVRVVREDQGDAATDEVGELLIKGPNVMRGYWNRPADTDAAIADGWLHTGDAARKDDDGFYYVVDRLKDMFVSGDDNVFPAEIERVLNEHPAVREAAVVAVPDPVLGSVGAAFVVLHNDMTATQAELIAFCADRLAAYKVPVLFEFLGILPRNPAGKILKDVLRAEAL